MIHETQRGNADVKQWHLFTDASAHPQSGLGVGAYLLLSSLSVTANEVKKDVVRQRFTQTSSSVLELQTLLWALTQVPKSCKPLIVYTDSQNILSLLGRREALERRGYRTQKGAEVRHRVLYHQFYQTMDQWHCQLVKVPGHRAAKASDALGDLFAVVDRSARRSLREWMSVSVNPQSVENPPQR